MRKFAISSKKKKNPTSVVSAFVFHLQTSEHLKSRVSEHPNHAFKLFHLNWKFAVKTPKTIVFVLNETYRNASEIECSAHTVDNGSMDSCTGDGSGEIRCLTWIV